MVVLTYSHSSLGRGFGHRYHQPSYLYIVWHKNLLFQDLLWCFLRCTDDRTVTETISEEAKARRSSNGASAASLACVAVLMVAFLAAIAYGIFLFHLGHIPAPGKKTGAHRSANDTGADRG